MMNRHRSKVSLQIWASLAAGLLVLLVGGGWLAMDRRDALIWRMENLRAAWLDWRSGRADTVPAPSGVAALRAPVASPPATVVASYEEQFSATPTLAPTPVPATPTPAPLPESVTLTGTRYQRQTINNCGPATMAMMLSYWGWEGDQKDVEAIIRPVPRDKNVRWDEMVYYVKNYAGWLDALFRAGGAVEGVKPFIANGYPVVIATGYTVKQGWVGHYLLLTGYDDAQQSFIVQDATGGPDRVVPYADIDRGWQQFNRYFILVFPAGDREKIMTLLGPDADEAVNRQRALKTALAETQADPQNAFAWFNLGSNLNYFDRYAEAAEAFDKARTIGLPWRMMFYQFGPYRAYFNVGRYQDVIDLADAALNARPDLEENFFWRGWARYMLGDKNGAIEDFRSALEVNPNFNDARAALESLGVAAR